MPSYLGVQVFDSHPDVLSRKINLRWPSDVVDLELPASSFYHVTGTNPFYLYARLTRLGTITLFCDDGKLAAVNIQHSPHWSENI